MHISQHVTFMATAPGSRACPQSRFHWTCDPALAALAMTAFTQRDCVRSIASIHGHVELEVMLQFTCGPRLRKLDGCMLSLHLCRLYCHTCISAFHLATLVYCSLWHHDAARGPKTCANARIICIVQACIAAITKGTINVLAHAWDCRVGGRDMDELLLRHLAQEFKAKHGLDVMEKPKAHAKLLLKVTKCRELLTASNCKEAHVHVDGLLGDRDFRLLLQLCMCITPVHGLVCMLTSPVATTWLAVQGAGRSLDLH